METLIDEDFDEVENPHVFAVGARVQIVCEVPSHYDGWENEWYKPGMSPMVGNGKIYTIATIKRHGIYFVETYNCSNHYGWPAKALKLVPNDLLAEEKPRKPVMSGRWSPYVTTTTTSSQYIIG